MGSVQLKPIFSDYPKSLISRINEVYVFFNEIFFEKKNTKTSFIIVCFAAITLAIVLAGFMWCQCHVM